MSEKMLVQISLKQISEIKTITIFNFSDFLKKNKKKKNGKMTFWYDFSS